MFKNLLIEVLGASLTDFISRHIGKILTLILSAYLAFSVNLGTRTVAEHVARIARTPEAQDFTHELYMTVAETVELLTSRVRGVFSRTQEDS